MTAIGDWRGRGGLQSMMMLDEEGRIVNDPKRVQLDGWIILMLKISRHQLADPYKHNIGLVATIKDLDEWIEYVQQRAGISFTEQRQVQWRKGFSRFFHSSSENRVPQNEAGFLIRLAEKLERMIQHQWYIDVYGKTLSTRRTLTNLITGSTGHERYTRPILSAAVGTPPVPSIPPFHSVSVFPMGFTYQLVGLIVAQFSCSELAPRDVRLLAHRCGLRLSHGALVASWRPVHVYPPSPPPLNSVINLGYVSSDFTYFLPVSLMFKQH